MWSGAALLKGRTVSVSHMTHQVYLDTQKLV